MTWTILFDSNLSDGKYFHKVTQFFSSITCSSVLKLIWEHIGYLASWVQIDWMLFLASLIPKNFKTFNEFYQLDTSIWMFDKLDEHYKIKYEETKLVRRNTSTVYQLLSPINKQFLNRILISNQKSFSTKIIEPHKETINNNISTLWRLICKSG